MTPEQAQALRAPFPPSAIGKLPRITCRPCSKAPGKVCDQHSKQKCDVCRNYITKAHIHLDFVGHAAATDRLQQVDPEWTWEPVAFAADGCPAIRHLGDTFSLWIRLTVCGVTRLGVGIASSDKDELEKQLISDALRNAAMRFGVALDLWSKEDLGSASDEASATAGRAQPSGEAASAPASPQPLVPHPDLKDRPIIPTAPETSKARRDRAKARCVALQADGISIADEREARALPLVDSCNKEQLTLFEVMLTELEEQLEKPFVEAS